MWRRNPKTFEKHYYYKLNKFTPFGDKKWPGADGLYQEEREARDFPEIIFLDSLKLSINQILAGNSWVYRNRADLPEELLNVNFRDLLLTIRSDEDYSKLLWVISLDGYRLGTGRAFFRDRWATTVAQLSLHGFGIYPAILQLISQLVGEIYSSSVSSLSPGATKAWERAGAIKENNHYYLESNRQW